MRYVLTWALLAATAFAMVALARARARECGWTASEAIRKLWWGISIVAVVQIADFVRETTEGKGLGLLYHIQWVGVYWISLAVLRRRKLRQIERDSASV